MTDRDSCSTVNNAATGNNSGFNINVIRTYFHFSSKQIKFSINNRLASPKIHFKSDTPRSRPNNSIVVSIFKIPKIIYSECNFIIYNLKNTKKLLVIKLNANLHFSIDDLSRYNRNAVKCQDRWGILEVCPTHFEDKFRLIVDKGAPNHTRSNVRWVVLDRVLPIQPQVSYGGMAVPA